MAKMTPGEPQSAAEYDDRTTAAVKMVLVEIGQVLGSFRGKFVIVGGAVPWLLLAARGETPRCTEIGDAPAEQGEKRENTGSIRPMNNADQGDAASIECSGAFATGC